MVARAAFRKTGQIDKPLHGSSFKQFFIFPRIVREKKV
jgi:hypothetical protein